MKELDPNRKIVASFVERPFFGHGVKVKIEESWTPRVDHFLESSAFVTSEYQWVFPRNPDGSTGTPYARGQKVDLRAGILVSMDWNSVVATVNYKNQTGRKPVNWKKAEMRAPVLSDKDFLQMMWIEDHNQRQVITSTQNSAIEHKAHEKGYLLRAVPVPFRFTADSFEMGAFPRKDTVFFDSGTGALAAVSFFRSGIEELNERGRTHEVPVYDWQSLVGILLGDGSIQVGGAPIIQPFIDLRELRRKAE